MQGSVEFSWQSLLALCLQLLLLFALLALPSSYSNDGVTDESQQPGRLLEPYWLPRELPADLKAGLRRFLRSPDRQRPWLWCGLEGVTKSLKKPPPGRETYYGLNNQREQLQLGLVLAVAMGRPLLVSRYLTNPHDATGFSPENRMGQLFDLADLAAVWPTNETSLLGAEAMAALASQQATTELHLKVARVRKSLTELQAWSTRHASRNVRLRSAWGSPEMTMRLSPDERAIFSELIRRHLHYQQRYLDVAELMVAALVRATGLRDYACAHVRVGDLPSNPLVNCAVDYPGLLEPVPNASWRCQFKETGEHFRLHHQLRLLPAAPAALLILSNDPSEEAVQEMQRESARLGIAPVQPGELVDADPAFRKAWTSLAPIQQSIVELLACAYAPGPMLVSFPSTFDEHILQIRSWLQRPGSDAQLALFQTTMRRWMREKPVNKPKAKGKPVPENAL